MMKRKQIILVALFICLAVISITAQVSVSDRKFKSNNKNSLADLSIRQVKFSGKSGRFLKVEVENKGKKSSDLTRLLLTIEADDKSLKFRQREVFVTGIESGQTKWVLIIAPSFSVKNGSLKSTAFKLVIDPNQDVPESNETNNEYINQAESVNDNSVDEPIDSDESTINDEESSDESFTEDSESVENSDEESETSDENINEELENENDSDDESEESNDSEIDESENPKTSDEDTNDENTKVEKEKKSSKSSKDKKVKAVIDMLDNINVIIKPSTKSKNKP